MEQEEEAPVPLDWALAVERAGGNAGLAADLLEMLREELPQRVDALRAAAERNDEAMLQEEIHRVVGSCRYCGVPALERVAGHLDGLLRRGEPWQHEDLEAVFRAAEDLRTAHPPE
jgi:two-component system sensor histidine kinase BarA